jgi:hypothetical protein
MRREFHHVQQHDGFSVATVTAFTRNGNKLLSNQEIGLNLEFILQLSMIQYYIKQHTNNSQRNENVSFPTFPLIQLIRQRSTEAETHCLL